jgi:hypothetical protein
MKKTKAGISALKEKGRSAGMIKKTCSKLTTVYD